MTIISLDFSILYPGVCICRDFKTFEWLAVINTNITKKDEKRFEDLTETYPSINILKTVTRRGKSPHYHITERSKLINYLEATNLLIDKLEDMVKEDHDLIVCIEGISFGSKGNALVDISQATGIIKNKLVDRILGGDANKLFVFSPGELKNAIGCKGNAGKFDVYNKFIEDPILDQVKGSDLYQALLKEDWIVSGQNIKSPIVDLIDSYLGITKIYQILKDENNQ
jgi:Holliday junction resolvasome RuvABC endonuclease subunit